MNSIRAATGILLMLTLVVVIPYMLNVDPGKNRGRVLYGAIKKLKAEYTHLNSKIVTASNVHRPNKASLNVKPIESFTEQKPTAKKAKEMENLYSIFSQSDGNNESPSISTRQIHKVKLGKNSLYKPTVLKTFDKAVAKCVDVTDIDDTDTSETVYPPQFHSRSLVKSISSNNRKAYRLVTSKAKENGNRHILLDPYQLNKPSMEKYPTSSLCIFQDAFVDKEGNVCVGNHCLQSKSCNQVYYQKSKSISGDGMNVASAIYVISENQGYGFFHYLMENWIRLFAGLEFLQAHPEIKIHVINSRIRFVEESIRFLGLDIERMITGNYFSKVVFFPEPVGCGSPPRDLVLKARKVIHSQIKLTIANTKQILVIKRQGGRAISNHRNLVKALQRKFGAEYAVKTFTGGTFLSAMKIFASSDIIIAPHGAGLSNIIACKTGTVVIEVLLEGKLLNLCYMYLGVKLNLKYNAWSNSKIKFKNKAMRVDVQKIVSIVKDYTSL